MKKTIALSLIAASTMAFGSTASDLAALKAEINALKAEVAALKKEAPSSEIPKLKKSISEVKAMAAQDNIKWGVDLRTAIDSLDYKMADGTKRSNSSLMTNRLWLNMAYAPNRNNIFKGQLAYNKAFGADFGGNGTGAMPRGWGMDTFDWITNESLSGNGLKVRQAYWLYMADSLMGAEVPWTLSVGRRPSTEGFLVNLRDDTEEQSPLAHNINVEFDGASAGFDLSKVTGVSGMHFKICLGQGSTNATPMFSGATNYSDDQNNIDDIKLAGFIFTPYNDGQFIVKTQFYRAWDLPGYDATNMEKAMGGAIDFNMNGIADTGTLSMGQFGDMDGGTISVLVDGLTDDGILSDTKVFASLAMSKSRPNNAPMLGSMNSETGTSYWLGANIPVLENGTFGVEYNHGSKYWRPFTYGEDTMAGSKLATRGDAWEAYYTHQLTKALSAQIRYTVMDYDYTGSNNFFGVDGAPMKISDIKMGAAMGDPMAAMMASQVVEKAQDLRFYVKYKF